MKNHWINEKLQEKLIKMNDAYEKQVENIHAEYDRKIDDVKNYMTNMLDAYLKDQITEILLKDAANGDKESKLKLQRIRQQAKNTLTEIAHDSSIKAPQRRNAYLSEMYAEEAKIYNSKKSYQEHLKSTLEVKAKKAQENNHLEKYPVLKNPYTPDDCGQMLKSSANLGENWGYKGVRKTVDATEYCDRAAAQKVQQNLELQQKIQEQKNESSKLQQKIQQNFDDTLRKKYKEAETELAKLAKSHPNRDYGKLK